MAQAILLRGGAGGITSDDVTASKAQVLQGYKTVTNDSDDEVVEGEIVSRGNIVDTVSFENAYWDLKFLARMEQGFYSQNEQWKPCVAIPYEMLAQTIGVDRSKMLDTLTIAGKQGQIKSINTQDNNYRINKSTAFGIDNWSDSTNPVFYVDLQNGNAFYNRPDGHPHVYIDADKLGNATADKVVAGSTFTSKNGVNVQGQIADRGYGGTVSYLQGREDWANRIWVLFKNGWYHRDPYDDGHGNIHEAFVYVTYEQIKNLFGIDASKMLQGYDIAGVQGTVPRWVCNSGDVLTAYNDAGFVWDDTYAGRGRGVIVGIKNGSCIQNANWVFLSSPNLYPWNIKAGVNINGVVGTMQDYSAGRPVFDGATFNTLYVGGVANKDFQEAGIYRDRTSSASNYSRYAGGTTINVSAGSNFHLWANRQYVGFVLDRAILFTFFRQLKITYKLDVRMYTGRYNRMAGVMVYVNLYDAGNRSRLLGGMYKMHSSSERIGSTYNGDTYEIVIDTSSINQDGFVALCSDAYSDDNMSSAIGSVTFTKIELIN
nr:MAG TPA: hypothetical protein [Caudoviricetes sp.]